MATSGSAAVWSSTRVDGSSARVERGMGPTKQNPMHCNVGWFYGDCTIILDGGGDWAPDEISEVAALWDVPVRAEAIDAADHGFLIIACTRQFGGLHTQIDDSRVSISINGQQLDYFGLRDIPPGHTDYFHLPRREPHWPWLSEVDPILASCQTIYTWPIQPTHLKSQKVQTVQVWLDPQVRWDIDYVDLLLHRSQPSLPHARLWMWTNGCNFINGETLNKDDYRLWFARRDEFKIFVIDDGEYKREKGVGIVYFNRMPVSKRAIEEDASRSVYDDKQDYLRRSGAYRILVRLLKNKGCAGTAFDIIKNCWRFNKNLTEIFDTYWNFENNRLDLRHLPANVNEPSDNLKTERRHLNKFLTRHLKIRVIIKQDIHRFSETPKYCYIEVGK